MEPTPFVDSWRARLVAGVVLLSAAAVLVYLHREDIATLTGAAPEAVPADGPLAECLSQRYAPVDKMLADGIIDEARHQLFRQRAAAMCEDQFGG